MAEPQRQHDVAEFNGLLHPKLTKTVLSGQREARGQTTYLRDTGPAAGVAPAASSSGFCPKGVHTSTALSFIQQDGPRNLNNPT